MKIIAGTTHLELSRIIANALKTELIVPEVRKFSDGELAVSISNDLEGYKAVIVQSICSPASDNLFELLSLMNIAKQAKTKEIIAVIPYFGYSRNSLSARLVADLLEHTGADKVITVDLHSLEALNFLKLPIVNLSAGDLFKSLIEKRDSVVIVSPDLGGVQRAEKISSVLKCELAVLTKEREPSGLSHITSLKGNVREKNCVIIDDIVDTAGTLCKATEFLKRQGAAEISAFVTHSVLSSNAIEMLESSSLKRIYITNTIVKDNTPRKSTVIPIDDLIISALRKF